MRVTFVGASTMAVLAAKALADRGHEVVVIEQDPDKVEALADELDCGLIVGDGSRPSVLQDVGPEQTDYLVCVTDRDEANLLAALVGRSLGFDRVVPKVEDPQLEAICTELGLDDVIVPDREVAMQLVDLVEGRASPELTTDVGSGLRFFTMKVPADVSSVTDLDLPEAARAIARTRGEVSILADGATDLEEGDQLVLIVEENEIQGLRSRFTASPEGDERKKG